MNREYRPRSVLTEPMQNVRSALKAKLVATGSKAPHLLFNIHISTFIKTEWLDADQPEQRSACLEAAIEIALSVGYSRGKVIAVIIDNRDPWVIEAVELLKIWQIEFLVADIEADKERIVQFFMNAWGRRHEQRPSPKPVTNIGENWFRDVCDLATGHVLSKQRKNLLGILKQQGFSSWHVFKNASERYEIFREVALDKIVNIPDDKRIELEFSRRSSVDLVVSHPSPNMRPFLAIEIDGPYHERPAQIRKDRLKNSILTSAGIPLLRLALKDRGFCESDLSRSVLDFNHEKVKMEFSRLLEKILETLIESLYYEKKYIPDAYQDANQIFAQALEASIRNFQIDHSRVDMTEEIIERLINEAEESCQDATLHAKHEEWEFSSSKSPLRTNGLLANELASRLGDVITSYKYDVDNDGFSSAICCINAEGIRTSLQSPKIRLTMIGLSLPTLGICFPDILEEASRTYVILAAYSHLHRKLPTFSQI